MMNGVRTRKIRIFRNMVHAPFESRIRSCLFPDRLEEKAPGNNSRGFEGRASTHSNDYRINGEEADKLIELPMAAEHNAMIPFGVDCPLNAHKMAPAKRFIQISLNNWFFTSASF